MFLDNKYSFEFFQILLAVTHFSNVAQKLPEAVVQRGSVKKGFLKILQTKGVFPVNFAKFSRTPLFIEHLQQLLLKS